jgi:hypothetical protein
MNSTYSSLQVLLVVEQRVLLLLLLVLDEELVVHECLNLHQHLVYRFLMV